MTPRRLVRSLLAVLALALVAGLATYSAFSDLTESEDNAFESGRLSLTDNDGGMAMYSVENMKAGQAETRCLQIINDGTLDIQHINFFGIDGVGNLDEYIDLEVERGWGPTPFASCENFVAGDVIYDGTLAAFPQTANATLADEDGLAVDGYDTYKFTARLKTDQAAQGKQLEDVGFRWEASGSEPEGTVEENEETPPAPQATENPQIAGQPAVGQTLDAGGSGTSGASLRAAAARGSRGAWSGNPTSFAYTWLRCDTAGQNCTPIAGALNDTYTVKAADVGHTLRVKVTASNRGGFTSVTSAPTATVAGGENTPGETIEGDLTNVQPRVNDTITTGAAALERCDLNSENCDTIADSSPTYQVKSSDINSILKLGATFSDPVVQTYALTSTLTQPWLSVFSEDYSSLYPGVWISTGVDADWFGEGTYYARPQRCSAAGTSCVNAAAGKTFDAVNWYESFYKTVALDVGKRLRFRVQFIPADGSPSSEAFSEMSSVVRTKQAPVMTGTPTIPDPGTGHWSDPQPSNFEAGVTVWAGEGTVGITGDRNFYGDTFNDGWPVYTPDDPTYTLEQCASAAGGCVPIGSRQYDTTAADVGKFFRPVAEYRGQRSVGQIIQITPGKIRFQRSAWGQPWSLPGVEFNYGYTFDGAGPELVIPNADQFVYGYTNVPLSSVDYDLDLEVCKSTCADAVTTASSRYSGMWGSENTYLKIDGDHTVWSSPLPGTSPTDRWGQEHEVKTRVTWNVQGTVNVNGQQVPVEFDFGTPPGETNRFTYNLRAPYNGGSYYYATIAQY